MKISRDAKVGLRGPVILALMIAVMLLIPVSTPALGDAGQKIDQIEPAQDQPGQESFNITISNITFSKDNPREGDNITISLTITNNETIDLSNLTIVESVNVTLMHFEDILISWTNFSLKSNSSETFDFFWKAESGIHTFTAVMTFNIKLLNMGLPMDRKTAVIDVTPESIGNLYYPTAILLLISVVIFCAVISPAFFDRMTDRDSPREKKSRKLLGKKD
ncbi:MAG: hypothetical protein KGY76_00180 [Candidatus Thermoplasmatota archaeon]|nr:hypothetical protein [Candidatus Thermoplasmatota archaeon]